MPRLPRLNVVLEGHKPILDRLSPRERKAAEHAAMHAGAVRWFTDYGPLRFTPYSRARLGYVLKSGHAKRKKGYGVPEPLIWTGETREAVLSDPRFKVGGPAGRPWVEVRFRLPGPRAPIVYEVLSTILDSEMGGFAQNAGEVLTETLGQATGLGGKSNRVTLRGATSSLGGSAARLGRKAAAARSELGQAAEDRRVAIAEARPAHQARVARRLKRTHDRWRRTAGGAAPTQAGGMSQSYLRSSRYRRARQQAAYRARYR